MKRIPLLATSCLAALTMTVAGCGSGGATTPAGPSSADPSASAASPSATPSPVATSSDASSTTPSGSANTADARSSFCRQLRSTGGPANAFMVIPTYSVSEAKKTTKEEKKILDCATPPAELERDWATWKAYVDRVYVAARKPGAGMDSMLYLAKAGNKVEPPRHRLENYAFAHCP